MNDNKVKNTDFESKYLKYMRYTVGMSWNNLKRLAMKRYMAAGRTYGAAEAHFRKKIAGVTDAARS